MTDVCTLKVDWKNWKQFTRAAGTFMFSCSEMFLHLVLGLATLSQNFFASMHDNTEKWCEFVQVVAAKWI